VNGFIARTMLAPVAGAFTEAQFLDALRPLWDEPFDAGLFSTLMTADAASRFMRKWGRMNRGLVRDHYRRVALARDVQHR
jgi:NAD(P)-dependent dehydrogenase (short-subunit alcohol dehydrogenase family)